MAVVAAAAVGAYGAYESSRQQKRASEKAGEAAKKGSAAMAELYAPYREFGESALPYLQYLTTGAPEIAQNPEEIARLQSELSYLEDLKARATRSGGKSSAGDLMSKPLDALVSRGMVPGRKKKKRAVVDPNDPAAKAHRELTERYGSGFLAVGKGYGAEVADIKSKIEAERAKPTQEKLDAMMAPSKLYEFQLERGGEAIDKALAARGLYKSGAGIEAQSDLASRLAAEDVERKYQKLLQATQIGAGAASGTAPAIAYGATGASQAAMAGGAANAALYENIGNIAIAGLGAYQQQQGYNQQRGIYDESVYKSEGGYGPYRYEQNYRY